MKKKDKLGHLQLLLTDNKLLDKFSVISKISNLDKIEKNKSKQQTLSIINIFDKINDNTKIHSPTVGKNKEKEKKERKKTTISLVSTNYLLTNKMPTSKPDLQKINYFTLVKRQKDSFVHQLKAKSLSNGKKYLESIKLDEGNVSDSCKESRPLQIKDLKKKISKNIKNQEEVISEKKEHSQLSTINAIQKSGYKENAKLNEKLIKNKITYLKTQTENKECKNETSKNEFSPNKQNISSNLLNPAIRNGINFFNYNLTRNIRNLIHNSSTNKSLKTTLSKLYISNNSVKNTVEDRTPFNKNKGKSSEKKQVSHMHNKTTHTNTDTNIMTNTNTNGNTTIAINVTTVNNTVINTTGPNDYIAKQCTLADFLNLRKKMLTKKILASKTETNQTKIAMYKSSQKNNTNPIMVTNLMQPKKSKFMNVSSVNKSGIESKVDVRKECNKLPRNFFNIMKINKLNIYNIK